MKRKTVGIWIRVSTNMQAQGDSPEHHEERARMYAQVKNWHIVEVYHLEAVSGKSVLSHREAKRMIADIKRGHIDGIIFSKIARLARNTKELLEIAEIFEENEASLISLDESIDTSTPSGRFFYTLLSAMAQWEREEIAERVASSVKVRAKLGKPLGGQAPFGYTWEENELVIDEQEAPVRKLMYELFLKHKRKRTVARLLNEKGYSARKGKFSDNTVSRLLEDPIAKGLRRVNYTTARKGKRELKHEDEWEFVPAPAIISEATYDKVQSILKEQRKHHTQPLKTGLHLFTGIVHCSCGGKMYTRSQNRNYQCKNCKRKIAKDDLESIFHEQLHSFSLSPDTIETLLKGEQRRHTELQKLLISTNRDIEHTEKEINSLFILHQSGQLDTHDFSGHYKEPKERLEKLKEQFENLSDELQSFTKETTKHQKVIAQLQDIYGSWNKLTQEDKRSLIETMTERIIIHDDMVDITLKQVNPTVSRNDAFGRHKDRDSLQPPT